MLNHIKSDAISRVEIDAEKRLRVYPASTEFLYIYREAMEVHWDQEGRFLYSPPPRKWTYADWFAHILKAALEQSVALHLRADTEWVNVEVEDIVR